MSDAGDYEVLNLMLIVAALLGAGLITASAFFRSIPQLMGGLLMLGSPLLYVVLIGFGCLDTSAQSCEWYRDQTAAVGEPFTIAFVPAFVGALIARFSHGNLHKVACYIAGVSACAVAGYIVYILMGMWIEPETLTGQRLNLHTCNVIQPHSSCW